MTRVAAATDRHRLALLRGWLARHALPELTTNVVIRRERVGLWASRCRSRHKRGALDPALERALGALPGWSWDPPGDLGARRLAARRDFAAAHDLATLRQSTVHRGVAIGDWVGLMRTRHATGKLKPPLAPELEAIPGWTWRGAHEREIALLEHLLRGRDRAGAARLIDELVQAALWIDTVRLKRRQGTLPRWLAAELGRIPGWRHARGPASPRRR